jgi:cytochrome b
MSTTDLAPGLDAGAASGAAGAAPAGFVLWDLPLRVFHWSLVASVAAAITTGELGGAWMPWHGRAGLAIVGLLAFRLAWGVVGPPTARFAQFAPTPRRLADYLRGRWRGVGHNPLGALAVFAMLALLAAQAASGLFGNDDIAFAGPLNRFVDDAAGARATGWHRLLADGLFALLALHLAAIAFHVLVKRHRLLRPMVTGRGALVAGVATPSARPRTKGALPLAVGVAAAVVFAVSWAGRAPAAAPSPAVAAAPGAGAASQAAAPAW